VVRRVFLEVLFDVVPLELWEKASDILLVLELGWVRRWNLDSFDFGVKLRNIEKVASATTALS
jgi:hypothetical protein